MHQPKRIDDIKSFLVEAQKKSVNAEKLDEVCLLPFYSEKGRKLEHYTKSNIAFIDIDDEDGAVTKQIMCAPEYFCRFFKNIYFIQKSYSGKSHLAVIMPEANSVEEWKRNYEGYVKYFIEEFQKNYGIDASYAIDYHSAQPAQMLFVSGYEIYFNDSIEVKDEYFKYVEGVKNGGCLEEINNCISNNNKEVSGEFSESLSYYYNNTMESSTVFDTFSDNIKTDYVKGQIVLNFTTTQKTIDSIFGYISKNYSKNVAGRHTLLRPAIYEEGVYSVKIVNYIRRDGDKIVKIKQGSHRRMNIKRIVKSAVLNYIATRNFGGYVGYDNIIATIKWYIMNCIEVCGNGKKNNRDITDAVVIECIEDVYKHWSEFPLEYKVNSYWSKKDRDEDIIYYIHRIQKMKYKAIDETAVEFIKDNGLEGKKYSEIASILNENGIASKTKNKWSEDSVRNLSRTGKISSVSNCYSRIDELLSDGEKYADIASKLNSEGYLTKQGKEFTETSIKNYVRRKK